ncbi:MAG: N-acetylmuramoyl-L-alanine amidase [Candidatus Babeliaceae bacterium]|nr:N-acetylmuramoyl-L-alanine amidase [Candidatus Babeliaceae bacterium]
MARYNLFFLLFLSCLAFTCGALWYAIQTEIIIFSFPAFAEYTFQQTDKRKITLFWHTEKEIIKETTECIWSKSLNRNMHAVISTWLCYMQDENLLDKRVKLETVALVPAGHEVYLSFNYSLFEPQQTIIKKWYILESLFATLKPLFPELKMIRLLVNCQPLYDEHIDCSVSLPVTNFLKNYQNPTKLLHYDKQKYIVVIHPTGDKNKTGRVVAREFERKLNRQLAQEIKQIGEEHAENYKVVITHDIGQQIEQEESATLANRLGADVYIHINCFESKKILPEIICYFSLYNPETDFWHKKRDALSLHPIDKAYLASIHSSLGFCTIVTEHLKNISAQRSIISGPYGLPLAPLMGIQIPSCIIECGIQKPEQITEIACVIAKALKDTLKVEA